MGPAAAALVTLLSLAAGPAADTRPAAAARRTVVVLYSNPPEAAGLHELSVALSDGIRAGSKVPVDVYGEYTGLDRFSGAAYEDALLALYREKYARRKIDLLVVEGPAAMEFVNARNVLPEVPVVTSYVRRGLVEAARAARREVTGALPSQNAPRTLEMMLSLYPGTRRILVVLGGSAYERGQADQGRILFAGLANRIEISYTNDLPLEQVEAAVATLPDDTLVVFGSFLQDAAGRDYDSTEPLTRISRA
ncbi:MAG TPA: hypothetical protein VGF31_04285, partial [Myxococcaceae bacterium]